MLTSTPRISQTTRIRNAWIGCICLLATIFIFARPESRDLIFQPFTSAGTSKDSITTRPSHAPNVDLVVASQVKDDTTWLEDAFADWRKLVYVVDDPNAVLTVPKNKGREGIVYLTYILGHYDELPNIVIFSHANRFQWHNDDPLYDGQRVLSRLRLPYVEQQGYVNLRCVMTLGCPSEIRPYAEAAAPAPASDPTSSEARAGSFYKGAFETLFSDVEVPEVVGAACCAQFAVSAERIRERPRSDYDRYRTWLL